ncbi:Lrp/AsnC family transcriptional regulator [Streptantibioticus silvisoli]|uniref:Lrp/AsnC family transcriptional regulator n=1 Tax=Streptantibioticus silvisoli TaxID=2705255 RepID=A0ABT6VRX8_9ACTN|nr:Lrp/AsnC family transcriptional regulator [Streptantibioticus silvisoli]MDI5961228.1 Lrp/AsnC family transcriptional regulator [Streptantibioticus silvisoli]
MLSEGSLEIVDALQISPRAPWSLVGEVLQVDPVTVRRRWERLTGDGTAWVSAYVGSQASSTVTTGFLEISCEPGRSHDVAHAMAHWNNVVTVQYVAGQHDLLAIVFAADFVQMSQLLLVDLPSLPGVSRVRSSLATRMFEATGQWRLGVLSAAQVRRLRTAAPRRAGSTERPFASPDRDLFRALSQDGRGSNVTLGSRLSLSARQVQRRLTALLARDEVMVRCDVARSLVGWPSAALLWFSVPEDRLEEVGRKLGARHEVRTCAALADERNLLLSVGLRSIGDLHGLVSDITAQFPYARIRERNLVLRQEKLCGHLLDAAGRTVGSVPLDPWATARDSEPCPGPGLCAGAARQDP